MLNLFAAFDVIDHDILFNRLQHSFGIDEDALLWIKSYLHGRSQRVAIGTVKSNSMELKYGVPQGSVLGQKMYCIFSKPIGVICSRHDLCYHCYADDTQLYFVIKSPDDWSDVTGRCLSEISAWMKSNMLKLNEDKTELIVFASA